MEEEPETVVLSGTPSAESGDSEEFNPYAGAGAYQQPMVPVVQANDNATYSMWLGIATWVCHITSGLICFTACLAPFTTIAGIVLGHMGMEAVIGAATAAVVGWLIYQSYGKKHQSHKVSPWETFRLMSTDPQRAESRRRASAFFAADTWGNNLLTLRQFMSCVDALGMEYEDVDTLRDYFHAADDNSDGLIHLEQFLMALETMASDES